MLAKIGLVIVSAALATFAMGRFESLAAHRGFGGSVASAQDWSDQADDASSQDDPDAASEDDLDAEPATSAGGVYSGTIVDNNLGNGMIQAAITQIHSTKLVSKLLGNFIATFPSSDYGPGFVTGKINHGSITALLRFTLRGKCGLSFHGTFKNGNEISGTYTMTHCGMSDAGSFDMFQ
jgi:hypothetical protein